MNGYQHATRNGLETTELWLTVIVILTTLCIGTLMLWFGKIQSDDWLNLAKWVPASLTGAYSVSRALVKGLNK